MVLPRGNYGEAEIELSPIPVCSFDGTKMPCSIPFFPRDVIPHRTCQELQSLYLLLLIQVLAFVTNI